MYILLINNKKLRSKHRSTEKGVLVTSGYCMFLSEFKCNWGFVPGTEILVLLKPVEWNGLLLN